MDEVVLSLIKANIIAAEAAFELNPTENMEKWWDVSEGNVTRKKSQNHDKPQK